MKILFICIISSLLFASCSSSSQEPNESKLDASLRIKLDELRKNSSQERIGIIGKCSEEITKEMKEELSNTGTNIQSTINQLFTADASINEIIRLSNLEFVVYLELSQKKEPKL
jgi:hypothetical protein